MAKKIYISPSDQVNNAYGAGNTTEAIQCRKIAQALVTSLQKRGFEAKTNLTADMKTRVAESNEWEADIHLCLHSNAFDEKVSGTRIFCYKVDKSTVGYQISKAIMETLAPITPGTSDGISARPELYEIRNSNAPCTYIEVDFHDVDEVALWIISHITEIAESICQGVCNYFKVPFEVASFEDVPADAWYAEDVQWAVNMGIVKGVDETHFCPNNTCTRAQVVAMLHRLYEATK